jgi:hypothetical protein
MRGNDWIAPGMAATGAGVEFAGCMRRCGWRARERRAVVTPDKAITIRTERPRVAYRNAAYAVNAPF